MISSVISIAYNVLFSNSFGKKKVAFLMAVDIVMILPLLANLSKDFTGISIVAWVAGQFWRFVSTEVKPLPLLKSTVVWLTTKAIQQQLRI